MSRRRTGRAADLALVEELQGQLGRLVDRLHSSSDVRLSGQIPAGGTRADAAHQLAQRLADAAATLVGDPVRPVPRLDDLVVGDQVAVTGADLLAALRSDPSAGAAEAAQALAAVRALRDGL